MKLGKLSLVAVMALGTSAFAIDNVKVNGEAKLWYQTSEFSGPNADATDVNPSMAGIQPQSGQDFFDHDTNSLADIKLSIGATADLLQNISAGVKVTALTTLGLENNLVGATPAAKVGTDRTNHQGTAAGQDMASLDDQSWVEEAYLAYTMGKTTVKVGRQPLATPLAFTENWNVVDNTFEAAVLINNDLPDTTLVAAWVGKHNGIGTLGFGRNTTVSYSGDFSTFGIDGAYAAGAINKSIPNTTLQGWYYNVPQIADALWLQADGKYFDMLSVGVQYAEMNPKVTTSTYQAAGISNVNPTYLATAAGINSELSDRSTDMFSVKGAVDVAGVNLYAAYSSVSSGTVGFANVATGDKTMMYTGLGSVYMDGEIAAAPDTDTWKIGASTKLIPNVTLSASYAEADTGNNGGTAAPLAGASTLNTDFTAWDIVANTNIGQLGLTAIYTQFDKDVKANDVNDKTTDTFRLIASLKF